MSKRNTLPWIRFQQGPRYSLYPAGEGLPVPLGLDILDYKQGNLYNFITDTSWECQRCTAIFAQDYPDSWMVSCSIYRAFPQLMYALLIFNCFLWYCSHYLWIFYVDYVCPYYIEASIYVCRPDRLAIPQLYAEDGWGWLLIKIVQHIFSC